MKPIVVKVLLPALLLLGAVLAAAEDQLPRLPATSSSDLSLKTMNQSFSVTCYLGNPNDRQSLGSITVNSPGEAGSSCNSLYFSCQGRCYGCYADFDLSEDICVNSAGRKFIR